jgi:hypothetical protein
LVARHATKILIDERRIAYIFREAEGHLPHDTPENWRLLLSVTNDAGNIVGTNRYSNVWSTWTLPDGRQVWVQIRRNRVTNGVFTPCPASLILDMDYPLRLPVEGWDEQPDIIGRTGVSGDDPIPRCS